MATLTDEVLLEEIARQPLVGFSKAAANFRLSLYKSDTVSYHALEEAFHPQHPSKIKWGSAEHWSGIMTAFKSPLYNDACKEYFAAANIGTCPAYILACDQFLTERIIFSSIEASRFTVFDMVFFAAIMGSEYLSERIVSSALLKICSFDTVEALELIPASMITPDVVGSWLDRASGEKKGSYYTLKVKVAVVLRIKQAHPEYEGFPDEWVMKVFCGE